MALRAVTPDERPPTPKSITQASTSGTQRELLAALRDRIAVTVEDGSCPPRDLASLSRRLMEIAKEIEALDLAAKQEAMRRGADVEDAAFDASAV